jgi:hypothetical protein
LNKQLGAVALLNPNVGRTDAEIAFNDGVYPFLEWAFDAYNAGAL